MRLSSCQYIRSQKLLGDSSGVVSSGSIGPTGGSEVSLKPCGTVDQIMRSCPKPGSESATEVTAWVFSTGRLKTASVSL